MKTNKQFVAGSSSVWIEGKSVVIQLRTAELFFFKSLLIGHANNDASTKIFYDGVGESLTWDEDQARFVFKAFSGVNVEFSVEDLEI